MPKLKKSFSSSNRLQHIIKKRLNASIILALTGKDTLSISVYEADMPYFFSLLTFYRGLKRKHVEESSVVFDWANTALLKWWVENEDPLLVPDHFYFMAEVKPERFTNKQDNKDD